jgi:hypothetical protein
MGRPIHICTNAGLQDGVDVRKHGGTALSVLARLCGNKACRRKDAMRVDEVVDRNKAKLLTTIKNLQCRTRYDKNIFTQ